MPPRTRRVNLEVTDNWTVTSSGDLTAFPSGSTTVQGNFHHTVDVDFWEEQLLSELERQRRVPPIGIDNSGPSVNIKRHLSKSERDSRHNPAPDVKKIIAINLDDLVSI